MTTTSDASGEQRSGRPARSRTRRGLAGLAATTLTAAAAVGTGAPAGTAPVEPVTANAPMQVAGTTTAAFSALGPVRVADTRGPGSGLTRLDDHTIRVSITDHADVPDEAIAAALTVTAVGASADGYVTVSPAGGTRPEASNLNVATGEVRANGALTRLGDDGAIDVYTSEPVDVLIDVSGVFVPADDATEGRFVAVEPDRRLDTRVGEAPTAGAVVTLSGVDLGVPASASAVAVNLTAVEATTDGYFTLWPAGEDQPEASVLNVDAAGQTRAAFATVPLGADAGISVFTSRGAHLLVDVVGYYTGSDDPRSDVGLFVPRDPERILDTRGRWPLSAGAFTRLDGIAPRASAIAANWTSVDAAAPSFITVGPDLGPPYLADPEVSTVNGAPFTAVANLAITPIGEFGVAMYSHAGEHALADVAGYFTGAGGLASLEPPELPEQLPGSLPRPAAVARPPVDQLAATAVRLEPALPVSNLTGMAWSVLEDSFYAISQDGYVHRIPEDLSGSDVVLDLSGEVSELAPQSERGLLGIAFDPVDGRMFLSFTDRAGHSHVVSYALVDGVPAPESRREVLSADQPGPAHNGGAMHFDERGHLFIAFGDGGASSGWDAQDDSLLHGTIVRIEPDRDGDGYRIPADNPLVGVPGSRAEIWVSGLRNLWQFSIDAATGDVWIGDVGEASREELNVVPAGARGLNFGWPWFEGTQPRRPELVPAGVHPASPVFEYGRTDGVSIIGGAIYHGDAIAGLRGAYVFADMSGPLFAYGADGGVRLDASGAGVVTGFAETPDRELIVLTLRDGMFRLLPG